MKFFIHKSLLYAFIFLKMSYIWCNANISFTFDSLFPSSQYKKVMTTCMHIRNSTPILNEYKECNEDVTILIDLMMGRITYLQKAIDVMLRDKALIHSDDLEYLLTVIEYLGQEVAQVFKSKPHDNAVFIADLINGIKKTLEAAL